MTRPSKSGPGTTPHGAPHCEKVAKLDAEAAKKAEALATMHENLVKETP